MPEKLVIVILLSFPFTFVLSFLSCKIFHSLAPQNTFFRKSAAHYFPDFLLALTINSPYVTTLC